jgi:hypothetical protein
MGMFAETVIVDYRLSFADQGKQTYIFSLHQKMEVCHFHFLFAANKWKFLFSVSSFFCVCVCVLYAAVSNGNGTRKPLTWHQRCQRQNKVGISVVKTTLMPTSHCLCKDNLVLSLTVLMLSSHST